MASLTESRSSEVLAASSLRVIALQALHERAGQRSVSLLRYSVTARFRLPQTLQTMAESPLAFHSGLMGTIATSEPTGVRALGLEAPPPARVSAQELQH